MSYGSGCERIKRIDPNRNPGIDAHRMKPNRSVALFVGFLLAFGVREAGAAASDVKTLREAVTRKVDA